MSEVERAARVLYLNKTCYNGLYRVNNAGEFNSPFGNYRNPNIVNEPVLRAVNAYFNTAAVHFSCMDYAEVLVQIKKEHLFILTLRMTLFLIHPVSPAMRRADFPKTTRYG